MAERLDDFVVNKEDDKSKRLGAILKANNLKDLDALDKRYEYDFSYKKPTKVEECTTVADLLEFAAKDNNIEIDAKVLTLNKGGPRSYKRMNKESFINTFIQNTVKESKIRESFSSFSAGDYETGFGTVGQDFISTIGGPFNKQLYIADYLKMIGTCYMTANHDPIARRIVSTMVDFTLGRGWRVDIESPKHLAVWKAFEEVNNLYEQMKFIGTELSMYGETMIRRLPNRQTKIEYDIMTGQASNKAYIPRVRVMDPSMCWDICTYPEDITRVLFYQIVSPTQYQIYTGMDKGKPVQSSKFIMEQIPGDEMFHYKVNVVSNEKRGRSDLFPVLGYLKRLRDAINYSIIKDQKNAAWSIDTSIEGSQTDIDSYIASMSELGTIPPAGSEFVHTSKVTRTHLGSTGGSGKGGSSSFEWTLSMIAAGCGIPMSYFGTHLSGGQTRASAVVATEPVAKMFEARQLVYEKILKDLARDLFKQLNMEQVDIEVTFPELIAQDRSAKLKDLQLAESAQWLSKKDCAAIAAKEFNITDYDYEKTKSDIAKDPPAPLTAPAGFMGDEEGSDEKSSAITGKEKSEIKDNGRS